MRRKVAMDRIGEGVERMLLGVGTLGLWTIADILIDLYRDWYPKKERGRQKKNEGYAR